MKTQDKPLHGTISHLKGSWSVVFEKRENTTSTLSGYGSFPKDQYNIPVIDFSSVDLDTVFEALRYNTDHMPGFGGDLNKYLNFIKSLGIKIN